MHIDLYVTFSKRSENIIITKYIARPQTEKKKRNKTLLRDTQKFIKNGTSRFQILVLFSVDKTKLLSHKALVVLFHLLIKWNKEAFRKEEQSKRATDTLETQHFKMRFHAQKMLSFFFFFIVFFADFFRPCKGGMSE